MARVLLIDDEPIYYKMIVHALKPHGYEVEYARTGMDGLKTVPLFNPDLIITDVRLPDLSGYEVAQRLRRDPRFENIPLIFLTSQADLSNKLKAFEVGADDYLSKPFQPEELVARVGMLVRRGEVLRFARQQEVVKDQAMVLTVHSLRGGTGCSSMAVNLGMALYRLWERPTLVIDSVLNAGQIALMLNASPMHTWEDLTDLKIDDIDSSVIESLTCKHSSGLDYIASPAYPIAVDSFTDEVWQTDVGRAAQHLRIYHHRYPARFQQHRHPHAQLRRRGAHDALTRDGIHPRCRLRLEYLRSPQLLSGQDLSSSQQYHTPIGD